MGFQAILERAVGHKGSLEAVEALLPEVRSGAEIARLGDDRLLAEMTKGIFQAGFSWTVIENKWPGFEEAFEGFEPRRWRMMSDEDLDRLVKDKRIVRNAQKILSVRDNAQLLCELADKHGSAAKCIADWPSSDQVGLMALLKKRGGRLGGTTGQYFLRRIGKDGFMLSKDVVKALICEGVVKKTPTSQKDLAAVQAAFDAWHEEIGRPYAHVSRILALSVG
jgi:3-methyladenine DNA glycosylase Tag